jgi:hypothetical protein
MATERPAYRSDTGQYRTFFQTNSGARQTIGQRGPLLMPNVLEYIARVFGAFLAHLPVGWRIHRHAPEYACAGLPRGWNDRSAGSGPA